MPFPRGPHAAPPSLIPPGPPAEPTALHTVSAKYITYSSKNFLLCQLLDVYFFPIILSTILQNYPHAPMRSETLMDLSKDTQLIKQ